MVHYRISTAHPHRHFISFEAEFPTYGAKVLQLQLPRWRPGRYELGNFARNIRAFSASDLSGRSIPGIKLSNDLWQFNAEGFDRLVIRYQYYAAELNAGSSYLDDRLLYINPVNCFFYDPQHAIQPYELEFSIPENFEIACGLKEKSKHVLVAESFDQLADCPLIASADMKHLHYDVEEVRYNVWIQGEVKLDETRLLQEFEAFTRASLKIFGDIPCTEYHFLFHFVPYFLRHGVEHSNSTVIAMGPAADFQMDSLFKDLLGISCHELFHTWNVKNIRPVEMLPYDFTRENHSRSGYVYEGVTTYYGDLLLWRSACINDAEWLSCVEEHVQDHLDNFGRFNLSVAESSFDTWLDGYSPGIPWRKVSIYNEGFLIAMVCDLMIMKRTSGEKSMDDVMKLLYERFGKKEKGYSEADYRRLVEEVYGEQMPEIFDGIISKGVDYMPVIQAVLNDAGVSVNIQPSSKWSEAYYGFSLDESAGKFVIQHVMPDSPADKSGLWSGDEILSVDGQIPYKSVQNLLRMQSVHAIEISRKGRRLPIVLAADQQIWMKRAKLAKSENFENISQQLFNQWRSRNN